MNPQNLSEIKFQNNKEGILDLPEDILINILLRLPAETVLRCRQVCKTWQSLTSTSYFIDLHYKLSKSSLLVQDLEFFYPPQWFLVSIDEKSMRVANVSDYLTKLIKEPEIKFELGGSCNGFILFGGDHGVPCIINPITREKINLPPIHCPKNFLSGFFFHPSTMEHRLLYSYQTSVRSSHGKNYYGYKVFSLEKNSWRDLSFLNLHRLHSDPATLNGNLYWLADKSIFKFDMNSEVFETISLPDTIHDHSQLIESNGRLYFCSWQKLSGVHTISVWILVDFSKQNWDEICRINHKSGKGSCKLQVMEILNGTELVFQCEYLFKCFHFPCLLFLLYQYQVVL